MKNYSSQISGPFVYIIVLNWNGWLETRECLESLRHLTYANFRVVLLDNGSVDGTIACAQEHYPEVTVIQNGANLGFAKANNRGINYALANGADYIMLLNNDTVVDPGFLEPLLAAFESDVEVGFASSKIYYYDRPTIVWFFGGEINWQTGWAYHYNPNQEDTSGVYNGLRATPIVTGCCLMARRAVLEQVGLLDPRFFAYYEDTDWSVRATRAGYKGVVVAQSHIWHKVSASAKDKKVTTGTFLFVRNGLLFTRKHARGQPLVALRFTLQWVIKPSIRGALRREAFWFRLMLLRIAAVLAHCCRCYYAVPAIVQQLATVGEDRRSAL